MRRQNRSDTILDAFATVFLLVTFGIGCGAPTHDVRTTRIPLTLGSDTVHVVVHTSEAPGLTYVSLHDDENTGSSAARAVIRAHGGRFVEIQHTGDLRISFGAGGAEYSLDPNRIFTRAGLDSTFSSTAFSRAVDDSTIAGDVTPPDAFADRKDADSGGIRRRSAIRDARRAAEVFSDRLLEVIGLDTLERIVAVHNNDSDGYSVRSYAPEGRLAIDARFAHITNDRDSDDFYLVTTERLYRQLRDAGFNVVLQDAAMVTDDGSLSVLCAQRGVPCVNVEAEHRHFEIQEQMLVFLHDLLHAEPAETNRTSLAPRALHIGRKCQLVDELEDAAVEIPKIGQHERVGKQGGELPVFGGRVCHDRFATKLALRKGGHVVPLPALPEEMVRDLAHVQR